MTKIFLSTGNVMSAGGPPIIRKSGTNTKSNLELVSSLREHFAAASHNHAPVNGTATPPTPLPVDIWTQRTDQALYIPRIPETPAGLSEETSQYEITVKLFLLPNTPVAQREQYVQDALDLVTRELGLDTIDLLVVSFPGMSFEGNCEWEADKLNAQQGNLEEQLATWKVFEALHRKGVAKRLGVAEFGTERLAEFLKKTKVPPSVDQINVRDCCNVPPPLKKLAEEAGVELNVHIDCSDILPRGTLRELLGPSPQGAGVLADGVDGNATGLWGEILPQWVVRYMAFVRDRGIIENKGYFAGAELVEA